MNVRRTCVSINHPFIPFGRHDTRQSIGARFSEHAKRNGDLPALESPGRVLTYAELDCLSNRVAHRLLQSAGASRSGNVILLFDHNPSMIVSMLGALKAGMAYVPVDPGYPDERIKQIVEHSQARIALTESQQLDSPGMALRQVAQVIRIDDISTTAPSTAPNVSIDPDRIAYVLYTSGSTGIPKGVMQTHRTVLCNIRNYTNDIHISQSDRLSLLTSFSFAASVSDLFGGLLNGATVCLYDLRQRGIRGLPYWLEEKDITIYYSVPSVFRAWASAIESSSGLPHLRVIKLGGDRVTHSDLQLYRDHFADTCVLQVTLGATEINLITRYIIDKQTPVPADTVPVGYPADDVEVVVVDGDGRRASPGDIGELIVHSAHLSPGYWNPHAPDDALMSADPHDPSVRVYRTGDIGRLLADGCLVHMGRRDSRVKIRGQTVAMAEVENALTKIDGVREGVVVHWTDHAGEAHLAAYFVAARRDIGVNEVRAELDRVLPGFMVPGRLVVMDRLPLNANGKVDRGALPDPNSWAADNGQPEPPRTETERRLIRIWRQTLDHPAIGLDDAFRDLGGDSLQALELVDAINEAFGRDLSPSVLLESDTVHKLADVLQRADRPDVWSPLVPIKPDGSQRPVFMVHALDGHVLGYLELARCLPDSLPLYGLEARGVRDRQQPRSDVPEMASSYLDAIRHIQPRGPYRLGGFSFGGVVAYEMACQLAEQQEEVEVLLIGDTWVIGGIHFNPARYRLSRFTYPFGIGPREWPGILARKLGISTIPQPATRCWGAPELHQRLVSAHKQAARAYQARIYQGRVTLLRAELFFRKVRRLQSYFGGSCMGWDRLARGGVDVHHLPCRHFQLFSAANAPRIVDIIIRALETHEAQKQGS